MSLIREITMPKKWRINIKKYMEENGLSRMDIVRGANASYPTVTSWEKALLGRIEAGSVFELMEYLKIPHEDMHKLLEIVDVPEEKAG